MSTGTWDDMMTAAVRVLTAWCGEEAGSGRDIVIAGNNTAILPSAKVQSPALQFHGWLHWKIVGTVTSTTLSFSLKLADNGVGVAGFANLTKALGVATTGALFMYECDLVPLGSHEGDDKQLFRETLTLIDGTTEAVVFQDTQAQICTLAQRTDHQLGFAFTTSGDAGATTTVRSVTCLHYAPRSDS